MDMDGKVMWKTMRDPLFDKGSMILADGLILATDGRTTLYLIEPDPSGFKPLASAELLKEGGTGQRMIPWLQELEVQLKTGDLWRLLTASS